MIKRNKKKVKISVKDIQIAEKYSSSINKQASYLYGYSRVPHDENKIFPTLTQIKRILHERQST